jgi:hypothetical protein
MAAPGVFEEVRVPAAGRHDTGCARLRHDTGCARLRHDTDPGALLPGAVSMVRFAARPPGGSRAAGLPGRAGPSLSSGHGRREPA